MMDIGMIGLGRMGLPLAANLAKAGHRVAAFDTNEVRLREAADHDITPARSAIDAAGDCPFVVTILPMPQDVEAVVCGPDGILDGLARSAVLIEMSTIDPLTVRRIGAQVRERGADMIDAPVTRSVDMAWQGRSALLVGGEPDTVGRAMPLLTAMSDLQTYCGPLGNGAAMKLVNNFMAAGILATLAEALSIGLKSGLTLETVMAATERSGTYNKLLLEVLPSRAFNGDFSAGFRTALALKDHRLALNLAESVGAHLSVGPAVERLFAEVAAQDADLDFTALLRRQELADGFEARLAARCEAQS